MHLDSAKHPGHRPRLQAAAPNFRIRHILFAAAALLPLALTAPAASPDPYLRLRDATLGYHGTSDDFVGLSEIRIGWFGPSDGADPVHGDSWWAASLAVQEANEARSASMDSSIAALPIRLVPRWAADPWGSGVSLLARMVYDDEPLALIGSVDSASTHLAEQVVAKVNLPLVSPIATDKTATLAGVSWMFSCAPDDTAVARALVEALVASQRVTDRAAPERGDRGERPAHSEQLQEPGSSPPATVSDPVPPRPPTIAEQRESALETSKSVFLLATTDHESRMSAREVMRALSRRGLAPAYRFDFAPGMDDSTASRQIPAGTPPAAVIVIADAADSARLTRAVRAQWGDVPLFGGNAMGRTRFLAIAGPAAEGVRFPLLFDPADSDATADRFIAQFVAQRQHAPDYAAALTYDATRLLIAAIRRAGPNRARIREALGELSPWTGIAGKISFDGTGQNCRVALRLGRVRHGAVVVDGMAESAAPGLLSAFSP